MLFVTDRRRSRRALGRDPRRASLPSEAIKGAALSSLRRCSGVQQRQTRGRPWFVWMGRRLGALLGSRATRQGR
jgi:hypothetical protein